MRLLLMAAILVLQILAAGCGDERMRRGRALERRGRWDDAIEVYQAAIRDYAYDTAAAHRIAQIQCYRRADTAKCRAWTERLEEWEPGSALVGRLALQLRVLEARQALAAGDPAGAERILGPILEEHRDHASALLLRGEIREARGQRMLAIADYRRVRALRPRWRGPAARLARLEEGR